MKPHVKLHVKLHMGLRTGFGIVAGLPGRRTRGAALSPITDHQRQNCLSPRMEKRGKTVETGKNGGKRGKTFPHFPRFPHFFPNFSPVFPGFHRFFPVFLRFASKNPVTDVTNLGDRTALPPPPGSIGAPHRVRAYFFSECV